VTIQRGQQESSAHENAEREDNGEMAEESRATQRLADFSNAGVEDGACDHGGEWDLTVAAAGFVRTHGDSKVVRTVRTMAVRAWQAPGGLHAEDSCSAQVGRLDLENSNSES
jgi:hypothetical protein